MTFLWITVQRNLDFPECTLSLQTILQDVFIADDVDSGTADSSSRTASVATRFRPGTRMDATMRPFFSLSISSKESVSSTNVGQTSRSSANTKDKCVVFLVQHRVQWRLSTSPSSARATRSNTAPSATPMRWRSARTRTRARTSSP